MSSPVFNSFGGPFTNMQSTMQKFNEFRQNFHGNPTQQLQQLMQSGQMGQSQYNQCAQMANQFMQFFGKR